MLVFPVLFVLRFRKDSLAWGRDTWRVALIQSRAQKSCRSYSHLEWNSNLRSQFMVSWRLYDICGPLLAWKWEEKGWLIFWRPWGGFSSQRYLMDVNKRGPTWCNSMQTFIYCKVTLHVSGVTAPIIRSTKNFKTPTSGVGHTVKYKLKIKNLTALN